MKDIEMALFDIDNTLVYGKKASIFYGHYARILEKSLAEALGIELLEGIKIAGEHRAKYDGMGEKAFQTYNLGMDILYDALIKLDPEKYLEALPVTDKVIKSLKAEDIIIGAITDGPRELVNKIFAAADIDISLFNFIIGWERGSPMPKYGSGHIYENVCMKNAITKERAVMVGDSLYSDVLPALRVGLKAIYISDEEGTKTKGYFTLKNIEPLIDLEAIV
jgi:FMN phosphatase YigB (HAD superfamily)